jgi:formylmethanofuran dehydrogenase subunit E
MSTEYPSSKTAASNVDPEAFLEPGQFLTRYGARCGDCGEFIPKGSAAGYNAEDEVVCEDCWKPWSER